MAATQMTSSLFHQQFVDRTTRHRKQLKHILVASAKEILQQEPFKYSDHICNELATDIMNGARLQVNAMAVDDEDPEMHRLNELGDMFMSTQPSTLLFLSVDDKDHTGDITTIERLFPMPPYPRYNIKRESVTTLSDCLAKLQPYLNHVAPRSLSTTIVILGQFDGNDIVFKDGTTLSRDSLEERVTDIVAVNTEHCPFTIDIVFPATDKTALHVTSRSISNATPATRVILTEA